MAFNAAYLTSNIVLQIFSCTPVEKFYEPKLPGTCISLIPPDIAWGAMSVISDLAIAVLPIPIIVRMKMTSRDKLLISLVFLVGLIAFAVALVRWILATIDLTSDDRTWKAGLSFLFCVLEVNTGIICACLPALKPLTRLARERSRSSRRKSIVAKLEHADETRPFNSPTDHSGQSGQGLDGAPRIDMSMNTSPFMPTMTGSRTEHKPGNWEDSAATEETLHLPHQGTL